MMVSCGTAKSSRWRVGMMVRPKTESGRCSMVVSRMCTGRNCVRAGQDRVLCDWGVGGKREGCRRGGERVRVRPINDDIGCLRLQREPSERRFAFAAPLHLPCTGVLTIQSNFQPLEILVPVPKISMPEDRYLLAAGTSIPLVTRCVGCVLVAPQTEP